MDELRNALEDKEELVKNLSNQISEYQSKTDLILNNNSEEDKNTIIEILMNEVKAIRQKIIDLISFNGRIDNYQEFINVINLIKNNVNDLDDNDDLKDAFGRLNILINSFEINDDITKMKLLREISKE